MAAEPGRAIPRDSARAFIVDAVPIVLQWPTEGVLEPSLVTWRKIQMGDSLPSRDIVHEFVVIDLTGGI